MSDDNWLRTLKLEMAPVVFFDAKGRQHTEDHVLDHTTLPETVRMSLERKLYYYAVFPYMGRWCLISAYAPRIFTKKFRYYDSKEAAEMVAIHRG